MDASEGTIAAKELCEVSAALLRLGFDGNAALDEAGVGAVMRESPSARVPAHVEHVFWEIAARMTADPAIGLRIGVDRALHGPHSLLDYMMRLSPTLGQGVAMVQPYLPLVDDRGHLEVHTRDAIAELAIYRDGLPRARGYVECLFAYFVTACSAGLKGFRLCGAALCQSQPVADAPYERIFGVKPRFGAPRNQLEFDRRFLDVPITGAVPAVRDLLSDHARNLLSALPVRHYVIEGVRAAISRGLALGDVSLERTARDLSMSARTLRRRLAELGTTYQQLLDDMRRTLASAELRYGDLSIDNLAERLQFASRSAFQRAFRRYTGMSPTQYRNQFGGGSRARSGRVAAR